MSIPVISTITLEKILQQKGLIIPDYQRPYSWTEEQLGPLLEELHGRKEDDQLIMGGLILHEDKVNNVINIVDGQQRLVSFSIIKAILHAGMDFPLLEQPFMHSDSIKNISQNVKVVQQFINRKKKVHLRNIYFVVVTTTELDDAFSFFDSQNTRGKKLEDYDILKAHHLRFIKNDPLAIHCAKGWENIEKQDNDLGLELLLETYLARGRKWSDKLYDQPRIRDEFKSQRKRAPDAGHYVLNYYQQGALFTSWSYNPVVGDSLYFKFDDVGATSKDGGVEIQRESNNYFPFQITQIIEGGELFFWYTQKYHKLTRVVFAVDNERSSENFKKIIKALEYFNYSDGCIYVKEVFKGAILFYVDKFGYKQLDEITVHLFFSIYWLRLKQSSVQYASINKYIREEFNPFALIKNASFPEYIIDQCSEFIEGKYEYLPLDISSIREDLIDKILFDDAYDILNTDFTFLLLKEKYP